MEVVEAFSYVLGTFRLDFFFNLGLISPKIQNIQPFLPVLRGILETFDSIRIRRLIASSLLSQLEVIRISSLRHPNHN